ncbi:MAG: radical SAM protein [Candidatus ainarchaeum sp.]|nr:radical SAM protein [Candidatus ainarchaeum sp.]
MKLHSITLINFSGTGYATHPSPPLWLAYLQAVLKNSGIRVFVIDEAAGQKIEKIRTEWVGLSVYTPTAAKAFELADRLRKQGVMVVLGGPHVTIFPRESLKHADKIVVGEGEKSILKIFSSKKKILKSDLAGDLDELPFPDWSGLPLEKYSSPTRRKKFLSIMTSRGCPFGCVYCYKGTFGRLYRARSARNVLDEISYLVENYGIEEIGFVDDNFTLSRKRVEEICHGIIERGLKIKWNCPNGVRVDTLSPELLRLMKKAGCYQLSFGIESGNQEVLDKIGKKITLEQVRKAAKWAKETGIETIGFFMIALPFDTEQTMLETINFAKTLDLDLAQFTITTPYPGTHLYSMVKENGKFLEKDFSKYGSYSGTCYYELGALNKELVERMYKKAYKEIYFRPGFALKRIIRNPRLIFAGFKYLKNIFFKKNSD